MASPSAITKTTYSGRDYRVSRESQLQYLVLVRQKYKSIIIDSPVSPVVFLPIKRVRQFDGVAAAAAKVVFIMTNLT